ncbi:MAG TPA: twin-arginine translocase subunit TatC [Acidimicrobiales bacterium]|nr:twin-arginine translocase subunit TatC [Acidimicrobiales bacterium]
MALRSRRGLGGGEDDPDAAPGSGDGGQMSLAEHLTELRSRVIKSAVAIAAGAAVGWILYPQILDILIDPYCEILPADRECRLIVTDPLEGFSIRIKLAAYVGLVLASPVVLWQLWRFITPGLYAKEKRYAIPFVLSSIVLFLLGAALALWSFPRALEFLVQIGGQDLEPFYTPGRYLSLVTFMMLAFGVGFEFPVVLMFLQIAGVLHWRKLASWRRYAIVIIFVATAVITPSGDPFTLLTLAIPLCLFYEANIQIGRFILKRP